ncbi:MAG: glutaredoxin family protein [Gammaproteobacteria bacterium]|nr:glutaredoxin family protein [Gammaproteobacteria bacterium]
MPVELTLYYRNNCHLCEQMFAEINANFEGDLRVIMVDVDSEQSLRDRYSRIVPVLAYGDTVICQGRLDNAKLEDYLAQSQP